MAREERRAAPATLIPVTVVTGFLGAGKTTLVNHWLEGIPRGDIAVIVNEHGDVGIDGELLASRVEVLREITGGCICCRTQTELVTSLAELASGTAKRILVETSGAASPAGVVTAIQRGGPDGAFGLDGIITVADASRIEALRAHDLAVEQLGYADIIVLSRADATTRDALEGAASFVSSTNGAAVVVESARGEGLALASLLDARRADFVTAHDVPKGPAHVYESISLVLEGEVDGERFADFVESELGAIAGRLFRTKGIVALAGVEERMIVQGVADAVEITFGAAWGDAARTSRVVIVGYGLDREALAVGFAATRARRSPAAPL